jgi:predicted GNAT family acetyltransferase
MDTYPLPLSRLDGEIAGTAGWTIASGMARFRSIRTVEDLRRRGVATSMIRFSQDQPQVRKQDGLVIFCDTETTIHLYERLGFVRHGYLWALLRKS